MAIRKLNPTTPGTRHMSVSTYEEITKTTPEKSLVCDLKSKAGRNFTGKITVRHKGGGTYHHGHHPAHMGQEINPYSKEP